MKGEPGRVLEFERLEQFRLLELRRPDDVDVAHARTLAFVDLDLDLHPVAREFLHLGFDAGVVAPLGDVLLAQANAHKFKCRLLEDLALAESLLGQPLEQVFALDGLVAFKLDRLDGRALLKLDHEHVAVAQHLNVVGNSRTQTARA